MKSKNQSDTAYTVHQYKMVPMRYITFVAPPTQRFRLEDVKPIASNAGEWRYKCQFINQHLWVSVEVGTDGQAMVDDFTDNVKVLKRLKTVRIKHEEDWDKIYQEARKVLGI